MEIEDRRMQCTLLNKDSTVHFAGHYIYQKLTFGLKLSFSAELLFKIVVFGKPSV